MIDLDKFQRVMELVRAAGCDLEAIVSARVVYNGVRYVLIEDKDTEECLTTICTEIDGLIYRLEQLSEK